MTGKRKTSILVSVFVFWMIVQTIRALVSGVEPYPSIFYPGFGSNGHKSVLEYELYKKEDSIYSPITHRQSILGYSRFRTLLKQIVETRKSNDEVKYSEWSVGLLDIKNLDKGDTLKINEIRWRVKENEYVKHSEEKFIIIL